MGAEDAVPADGALLALSAALAAACFVKAFGVSFLGRPRSARGARRATETDRFSLAAMCVLAALCLLAGVLPGLVIDALAPVGAGADRRAHAGADRRCTGSPSCRSRQSRSSYNGLLVFVFIAVSACADGDRDPPLRLARAAPRAGMGLRLPGSEPGDAIHRRQLRPADPPRVRHAGVPRARERRHAAAGRHAAGAASTSSCAIRSGTRSMRRSPAASARPPTGSTAAVPDDPAVIWASCSARWSCCCWCSAIWSLIRDSLIQGVQMLLVLLLAPLLTGFVRKVKARLQRRQGPPLIQPYRDLAGCCARRSCWRTTRRGCSASRPI